MRNAKIPATALHPPEIRDITAAWIQGGVVFLAFTLLIFWQASMTLRLAASDKPYESWDEIATYNNARVVSGPHMAWSFRYGSFDTFLQILANQYFLLFDPVGPGEDHYAVSNNNLSSFTSRHAEFDGSLLGTTFGYSYFRGLDDHQPIFLSRRIHLAVAYGLAILIGALALYYLGRDAVPLLLALCCLTANAEVAAQASMALPNAINAVIAFGVTLLGFLAVAERRESCLYTGMALVAIAANMKIDAILLGGVIGLAILVSGCRAGLAGLARQVLLSAGIFALVYAVTNPQVLTAPRFVLSGLMPPIGEVSLGLTARILQNLGVLRRSLDVNLLPWKISDMPLGMILIGLVVFVLGTLAIMHRRRGADLPALAIPATALLVFWLYPMLTITIFYGRYYLNGLGALYALIGTGLVTAWRLRTLPGRACVLAILALMLVQYGALMSAHRASAAQVQAETFYVGLGDRRDGFSRTYSRNEVERRAIEAWRSGAYDRTILVDQHGYFDLRMLRLAGMQPIYINLFNNDEVLRRLDRSVDHLLLLSPGSYATDPSWWKPWMSSWMPEMARRYDAYRARLDAFPVREEIVGPSQRLLSAGPVAPNDHVVLVVVPHE